MQIKSIRTFIGAKNYARSRSFYSELGFEEIILSEKMSYFRKEGFGFYLQDSFVKDWVENSMIFLEVATVESWLEDVQKLNLPERYEGVRVSAIQESDWGREFFLHDPSGILWHIGSFNS